MSTGAWWAEDTLVSKWLGYKVTSVPRADSLLLEPGAPGPTPGAREQKAESPQSRYLQPIICITTGVRVGGRGSLV